MGVVGCDELLLFLHNLTHKPWGDICGGEETVLPLLDMSGESGGVDCSDNVSWFLLTLDGDSSEIDGVRDVVLLLKDLDGEPGGVWWSTGLLVQLEIDDLEGDTGVGGWLWDFKLDLFLVPLGVIFKLLVDDEDSFPWLADSLNFLPLNGEFGGEEEETRSFLLTSGEQGDELVLLIDAGDDAGEDALEGLDDLLLL